MFDELNQRAHADLRIEDQTETTLRLWLGDCCAGCNASATVTFDGVVEVRNLDDDRDVDDPRLRLATDDERAGLDVPVGAQVFSIDHGGGPTVRIVAARATVVLHPIVR